MRRRPSLLRARRGRLAPAGDAERGARARCAATRSRDDPHTRIRQPVAPWEEPPDEPAPAPGWPAGPAASAVPVPGGTRPGGWSTGCGSPGPPRRGRRAVAPRRRARGLAGGAWAGGTGAGRPADAGLGAAGRDAGRRLAGSATRLGAGRPRAAPPRREACVGAPRPVGRRADRRRRRQGTASRDRGAARRGSRSWTPWRRRGERAAASTSPRSTSPARSSTASRSSWASTAPPGRGRHGRGPRPPGAAGPLVNLNTADAATLETLPGVGPVTAERDPRRGATSTAASPPSTSCSRSTGSVTPRWRRPRAARDDLSVGARPAAPGVGAGAWRAWDRGRRAAGRCARSAVVPCSPCWCRCAPVRSRRWPRRWRRPPSRGSPCCTPAGWPAVPCTTWPRSGPWSRRARLTSTCGVVEPGSTATSVVRAAVDARTGAGGARRRSTQPRRGARR